MKLKAYIRRSAFLQKTFTGLSFPFIWVLLKAEGLLSSILNIILKNITGLFCLNGVFNHKYFVLITNSLSAERLCAPWIKAIQNNGLSIKASLASAVFLRHSYNSGITPPEWKLDHKVTGLQFAQAIGLITPELYVVNVPFSKITPKKNIVIKPVDESTMRGVFIVNKLNHIRELKTGDIYTSWSELTARIQLLLRKNIVSFDNWMAEEFVSNGNNNPVCDIKFYTFYGKVGWISEIQRHPSVKYHIMDGTGKTIKSNYSKKQSFIGSGVKREEVLMVEKISLQIPAPFIRIDFLKTDGGLVFNEFTAQPGIIGYVNKNRDNTYGKLFHEAEARLYSDFLSGKDFSCFNAINS